MKPPSARIRKRRAPQRQQPDSHSTTSVPRRRSSRLLSRQRSVSILQSLLEQLPTDPKTSHLVGAVSKASLPTLDPIAASAPKPSQEQFQDNPCLSQTHSHQSRKRKRREDKCDKTGSETPPKRACLTRKNLKALEKMSGHTRQNPKSKSSQSRKSSHSEAMSKPSKTSESSSKTVSTTDSSFPRLVFENGVLDPLNSAPPENLGYLQDRLSRARDTESPTESEYQDFVYRTQEAPNEQTMLLETSKLLKEYRRGYRQVYNQALHEFPKSVGFNTGLSAPQPDMIEGLDLQEFKPFPVRQELGGAAVPTSENNATTLPHLAGEWKAGGKDMIQARTQAAYDGACMVYGRDKARSFLESPDPANYAYIQTFTIDGTTLNTFAHYSSKSQDQVKYYQYPTSSSFLTSSYKDFKQSRQRLRNQQDDANKYSVMLRDELNRKWSADQHQPPAPASLLADAVDIRDDGFNCDDQEDGEENPSWQLLTEYHASFNNQDQYNPPDGLEPPTLDFGHNQIDGLEVLSTDDGYKPDPSQIYNESYRYQPPNASTYTPVTPPYSSENVSLPLGSHMLSSSAVAEINEGVDDSNVHGHKKIGRSRRRTRSGRSVLKN